MDPRGDFIGRINAGGAPTAQYHALTANYEPSGGPGKLPCGGVGGHTPSASENLRRHQGALHAAARPEHATTTATS